MSAEGKEYMWGGMGCHSDGDDERGELLRLGQSLNLLVYDLSGS